MNRLKARSLNRSALSLVMALIVAVTCCLWASGAPAPAQAEAVGTQTITDLYGVTRGELVSWLMSHENDEYYLGTPFKQYDWRSPTGDINNRGARSDGITAGMNSTGFVWHALCNAHGKRDEIESELPTLVGWAEVIASKSLKVDYFTTKDEMLASGMLEKGDLVWVYNSGQEDRDSIYHHVGIFWGKSPDEDLMWSSRGIQGSTWLGANAISEIAGSVSNPSFAIMKLSGSLDGAISLELASADQGVTAGNDAYSLAGAVFGVFASEADAATRDVSKAVRTLTTDALGKAESGMDITLGTYYVAETTAPQGYALDEEVHRVEVVSAQTASVGGGALASTPLLGGIALEKRSSNESMTEGNGCYSLKDAEYGLFESEEDAATHDGGKASKTFSTGEDGTFASTLAWPAGTYYVAETKAPAGFALDERVYATEVQPGETVKVNAAAGFTSDAPLCSPVTLWATKVDAETEDGSAQGSATLASALFEVAYYDGYYDLETLPDSPERTWVVRTDGEGKARAEDGLLESGDELYRADDGGIALPLGTVTVREKQAPQGYLVEDGDGDAGETHLMRIEVNGDTGEVEAFEGPEVADHVKRGGVAVGKADRQNGASLPQGAAQLAGASFEVVSDNDQQVMVDGSPYAKGEVICSMEAESADGEIVARTPDALLPVGSYIVRETGAGAGYLYDATSQAWRASFEVTEQGEVVELTDRGAGASNQVVRGDFRFSKVDGITDKRLALIPFMVTSQTTGEQHVIMTDENGMVSTASTWNSHEQRTNANDSAVSASAGAEGGYAVDEGELDPFAGVWFNGRTDAPVAAADILGALPYDTYTVSELRVGANAGYELATFMVTVSRNAVELDLGTVDNTPLAPAETQPADGGGKTPTTGGGDRPTRDSGDTPAPNPNPDPNPAPTPDPGNGDGSDPGDGTTTEPGNESETKPDDGSKPDESGGDAKTGDGSGKGADGEPAPSDSNQGQTRNDGSSDSEGNKSGKDASGSESAGKVKRDAAPDATTLAGDAGANRNASETGEAASSQEQGANGSAASGRTYGKEVLPRTGDMADAAPAALAATVALALTVAALVALRRQRSAGKQR